MSYEPHLVIMYDALTVHEDDLEETKDKNEVDKYLYQICRGEWGNSQEMKLITGVSFEIVLCHPELTSFNHKVRNRLYELDVPYTEHN